MTLEITKPDHIEEVEDLVEEELNTELETDPFDEEELEEEELDPDEDPFDEEELEEEELDPDEDPFDEEELEEEDNDEVLSTVPLPTTTTDFTEESLLEDSSTKDKQTSFSESERTDAFDFIKGAYTIHPTQEIDIAKIAYSTPMKEGRKDTVTGLTKSIRESGVLTPIDVILLPEPDEEMHEALEEDGEIVPEYLLVSGLRRVFASLKNSYKTIPANIWDFKDKEQGQKACLELGLWINRTQKHSWAEVWSLYQVLEEKSQIRPAMAEFLFQMEGGDAMKLKDVMLCEYPEIREELIAGTKTLEQSYKQLMKERKDEDELALSDTKGLSDASEDTASIVDMAEGIEELDNSQVMQLMEMLDKTETDDLDDADFNELNAEDEEDIIVQDVKHRTFVDPFVKKSVLYRDDFRCTCCGTGGVAFLDVIIFHHIIPVHAGGADTIENGTTLCDTCHLTLHVAERNGGRLPMSKEQFDEYPEHQQDRIRNILKLAKVAYKADKLKGYSREEINKLARAAANHRMPGENIEENLVLYKDAQVAKRSNDKDNEVDELELA